MGQGMSITQGDNKFNTNFQSAINYNDADYKSNLTSTATNMADNMKINSRMIQNDNKDDVITYLLILQSMPMNKLLNLNLTGFNFNQKSITTTTNDSQKSFSINETPFSQNDTNKEIATNITINITTKDDKYVYIKDNSVYTTTIEGEGADTIKKYYNINNCITQAQYDDSEAPTNSWIVTSQGRILYKIDEGYGKNLSLGVKMFKCLVKWFNKLDDIQNQYLSYLTDVPNPSSVYINTIVSQADSISRQFANEFNDFTQGEVAGVYVAEMGDKVVTITLGNDEKLQNIKMMIQFNFTNMIANAQFNNGKNLDTIGFSTKEQTKKYLKADGSDAEASTGTNWALTDLGYYAYNLTQKAEEQYKKQGLDQNKNISKIWKFLYRGQLCVIVYSPTFYNQTAGYHIIPLRTFQQLVSKQKETYQPIKKTKENFNSKIGQAMNELNSETSDVGQMLNSSRMQQFKKNIEQNRIDLKNIKAEGFTAIYQ